MKIYILEKNGVSTSNVPFREQGVRAEVAKIEEKDFNSVLSGEKVVSGLAKGTVSVKKNPAIEVEDERREKREELKSLAKKGTLTQEKIAEALELLL